MVIWKLMVPSDLHNCHISLFPKRFVKCKGELQSFWQSTQLCVMCNSQIMKKTIAFLLTLSYIWKPSIQKNIAQWGRFILFSFNWPKRNFLIFGQLNNVVSMGPDFINDWKQSHFSLSLGLKIRCFFLVGIRDFITGGLCISYKVSDKIISPL